MEGFSLFNKFWTGKTRYYELEHRLDLELALIIETVLLDQYLAEGFHDFFYCVLQRDKLEIVKGEEKGEVTKNEDFFEIRSLMLLG